MNTKIIVLHENLFQSVVKDLFTFGLIGLLLYANHLWFGDKTAVALALMAFAVLMTYKRIFPETVKEFVDPQAAINYLRKVR